MKASQAGSEVMKNSTKFSNSKRKNKSNYIWLIQKLLNFNNPRILILPTSTTIDWRGDLT